MNAESSSVSSNASSATPGPHPAPRNARTQRIKLLAILLVCAAPVIFSYLMYYVFPPAGRTNFGELIQPQRPVPELTLSQPDGTPYAFKALLGQWVILHIDAGACEAACQSKLYAMRQQRTMTGKDRDRIDRVWLVSDSTAPDASMLEREYAGTVVLRADAAQLQTLFPVEPGRSLRDYLYIIDPLGNLMMRFPADGEPARIRKDIGRLLKASRVG